MLVFLEEQVLGYAAEAVSEAESEGVPVSEVTSVAGGKDTSEEDPAGSVDALTSVESESVTVAESVEEVPSVPVSVTGSVEGGDEDEPASVVPSEESVETSGVPVSVEVSEGVPVFVDEDSVCVEVEVDVEVDVDVVGGRGSIAGFSPSPIHSDFTSTA